MIDEKKLIESINNQIKWMNNEAKTKSDEDVIAGLKVVLALIDEQEKVGEWIPCSGKTNPKNDGFYIATIDGEICGEDEPFVGLAEFENGKWVDDEPDYKCVLFWQKLPEPYKEE